jgi:FtsP/CotA-like multicopper oxidase with cupredoxin domain
MHLHGFYFAITSRGNWAADTAFAPQDRPQVVTEMPVGGGTFAMSWVPDEPGNWMFHCHVAFHTSFYLSAKMVDDPADPIVLDPMHDMQHPMHGMVLGITVKPGKSTARRPSTIAGARNIRLIAQAAPKRWRKALDEMAFVRQDGDTPPAADSVPVPSSPLILERGVPVRITVVNHTRAPTGVHWHGIEVPSYSDGVPNFSGSAGHVSPMIAPGDSFVALFTPPRSGTFMYHAHSNESFQIKLGLYGSLLVVDSTSYHPERERIILLGADGPGGKRMRINGQAKADTMHLAVGRTYRLRVIDMIIDNTIRIALQREDSVVHWKAVAKDGAELALKAQVMSRASLLTGPGQTMDFEYTPTAPGNMRLYVVQRVGDWKTSLPIRVDP